VQCAGRILRPFPGKTTAEVHGYHDVATDVLASSLAKRAPRMIVSRQIQVEANMSATAQAKPSGFCNPIA